MPEMVGQLTVDLVGMIPRCRGCRFWGQAAPVHDGAGICGITTTGGPDLSSWVMGTGMLMTAPDFGCVQFQPLIVNCDQPCETEADHG